MDGSYFNPTPGLQGNPLSWSLRLHYFFPTFWIAVTMDTRGRKGAGLADMNRSAKTHLSCGRHGSRVHLTHSLHPRPLLSLKCVALWPLNTFPTLNVMTMWWMWFVSTGYFIYDFFDMLLNQKLSQSWELLFHHVVVGLLYILASDSVGDSKGLTWVNKCNTT